MTAIAHNFTALPVALQAFCLGVALLAAWFAVQAVRG